MRPEIRCNWNLKNDQNRGRIWEKLSQVIDSTSLSSLLGASEKAGQDEAENTDEMFIFLLWLLPLIGLSSPQIPSTDILLHISP